MIIPAIDKDMLRSFGKFTAIAGVLLVIPGSIGIVLPIVLSFFTTSIVGALLLVGGALWAYHSAQARSHHVIDWLKPA